MIDPRADPGAVDSERFAGTSTGCAAPRGAPGRRHRAAHRRAPVLAAALVAVTLMTLLVGSLPDRRR